MPSRSTSTSKQTRKRGSPARAPAPAGNGTVDLDLVASDDPEAAAKAAGLVYATDRGPGITRRRWGNGWRYLAPDGGPIKDQRQIARINGLVIPPAYTDVWINPSPRGHLQATGRDDQGRKQYRYHPRWRAVRDETKYERLLAFGQTLPTIRDRVDQDLRRQGLPREKVLATVVRLLETTLVRVGNEEYARTNESYGLTTMLNEHVDVTGATLRFSFRGKSGKEHHVDLRDQRLATIVKWSQDLPGQQLFQYFDEDGEPRAIDSGDVNDYLREISGQDFTAKDFRTWAGTVLAAQALHEFTAVDSEAEAKQNVVRAIETVAARLGNTRAVCRKCYIHPDVLDGYLDGTLQATLRQKIDAELTDDLASLTPEEAAILAFLRSRLADD
ncbi:MAG: DNA topoisomerase IB [Chloroflexia bacterium]|nr:DNA topoisomerase IB [Chloroflexia bacterium]